MLPAPCSAQDDFAWNTKITRGNFCLLDTLADCSASSWFPVHGSDSCSRQPAVSESMCVPRLACEQYRHPA
ncbi:hypothetical protein BJX63DRAFT_342229 [Aspergillus granulosus]|uniref:Uncharacterized protein n=1 Tax=Aspergillus granulosus TaxID=176169 RepID=A0ABR4H2Y0_9EURO